jgi:integrase/recombinase XerD
MSKSTFYLQACKDVPGFRSMGEEFMRKLVINGRAKSTHENYLRQMAKLALHYNQNPLELRIDQLEEYLYHLVQTDTESKSSFKHLIYGLRKLYYLFDKGALQLSLPSIKREDKKPVVLSHQEVKRLLKAPGRLWQRVMFGLVYDTGLRISELRGLLLSDVDLERRQVHVRKSKNNNDRYISMSTVKYNRKYTRNIHEKYTTNI